MERAGFRVAPGSVSRGAGSDRPRVSAIPDAPAVADPAIAAPGPTRFRTPRSPRRLARRTFSSLPLPEDRGAADLEQTLKRLGTTASLLLTVAHPDDERRRVDDLFLTRFRRARHPPHAHPRRRRPERDVGRELRCAGPHPHQRAAQSRRYYGARQLWGTEADFGFSKTQGGSFAKWGHDRVLFDAVLAVRMVRPQIILSTFVGGPSDGHGHHQVSGEIARESFKVAGDPLQVLDMRCG